jgi:alanine-glyoxylate transaminase / serine-glyoxylate transaminase / serine-pyruvate transaminase
MTGRPFLQIPGPTNVPERVLRAMDRAVIDHRGPAFAALVRGLLPELARVFKTERGRVIVWPCSGTGAWEASLVNVLAPGDRVLAFDHGHFSAGFAAAARNLGFAVDLVPLRWGQSVPP